MTEELRLVGNDYSTCQRCRYVAYMGGHADFDYCTKPVEPRPQGIYLGRDVEKYDDTGCSNFEWNGMTIHEEAYKALSTNPRYKESKLLQIKHKSLVGKFTWWEIQEGKGGIVDLTKES